MKKIRDVAPCVTTRFWHSEGFEPMIPLELVSQWRAAVKLWEKDSNAPHPFKVEKQCKNSLPLSIPDNDVAFCSGFRAFGLAEAGGRG